jgi:hypothetical protein
MDCRSTSAALSIPCALGIAAIGGCTTLFDESAIQEPVVLDTACTGRLPPGMTDAVDGADAEDATFVVREMVLDTRDVWRDIGFNLDGLCTSGTEDRSRECGGLTDELEPDGDDGIDNAFGHRLTPLALLLEPIFQSSLEAAWLNAEANVVMRVSDWNGLAEDPSVTVSFGHTLYGAPAEADGSAPELDWDGDVARYRRDGAEAAPTWAGADFFWLRDDDFEGGDLDQPMLRAETAWVTADQIVARLPDGIRFIVPLLITEAGGLNRVTLNEGLLVAKLSADRSALDEVIVAGRWPETALRYEALVAGYCMDHVLYDVAQDLFDTAIDVRAHAAMGDPSEPCDAMSFAVRASANRGRVGGVVAVAEPPHPCPEP